jgi:predicted ATP-grasp superfamily ATP-dependent carboligase
MSHLRWHHRPELVRPVLLAAFEGWNDAGESATTAVRYLARSLGSTKVASIDAEEYYDFTVARPQVRLDEGMTRRIEWPDPTIEVAHTHPTSAGGRDLLLLTGIEPALKWRTFTRHIVDMCTDLDVELVLTLGALLADVPHTRPVRVTGTATDPELVEELGFTRSRYEGPTGILGVMLDACREAGLRSASVWATTPHYLRETPSPKAALALVERMGDLLAFPVDTTELQIAAAAYERQVDDMLAGEDDVADYVRRLEDDEFVDEDESFELPSQEALAAEVERFLREQRGNRE